MTLALAARRQIGYALGRAAGGLSWLLRDDFTTDLPAGSVNGTAAEPGPGTRTVYDTNNKISLSGGKLSFATGGLVGDGLIYSAMTRTAGRMLLVSGQHSGGTGIAFGWGALALPNAITERIGINQPGINTTTAAYVGLVVSPTLSASTAYYVAYIQGATNSMFILLTGGDYAAWTLLWKHTSAATGTTPVAQMRATNVVGTADFIRVPDALWLPTPLASDGFGSTFGTTDGLGHAEGIAGGIGAGGGGVAWSNAGSTWSVSGGKAINTAPSGLSQQISVLSSGTANVFVGAALTRSAGNVGLALNMDSASSPANGVLVYLDGTNCKIDKIVAGSTSNVRTTAVTYSAGARLVVAKNGTEYRVYYNNALVGAANTISDAGIINNTLHGIFSTDASNTLDDYACYATGTDGEYATLDQYIQ